MRIRVLIAALIILAGCKAPEYVSRSYQNISQLKFLGEYDVPDAQQFHETTIGGLSGIDYDPQEKIYYLISDDRSAVNRARFYTAQIGIGDKGIDSVRFLDVSILHRQDGKPYPNSKEDPSHTPDPEALRYNKASGDVVWSSEGERIVKPGTIVLEDPSVTISDKHGNYKDTFLLPENMHMHSTERGPRQNGVFEGLTFDGKGKFLYVNVEEPIYEDGPRAGINDSTGWIRFIQFDLKTKSPVAEYAYQIDPVAFPATPPGAFKINGIPDILCVGNKKFIVLERSFSTGRDACTIKVFLADMDKATNILATPSIQSGAGIVPISKKLLLNMNTLGRYIDNIEGVTFGPPLPNGHRTLLFVADNNFSPTEKTQFLLFEVLP